MSASVWRCLQSALPSFYPCSSDPLHSQPDMFDTRAHSLLSSLFFWSLFSSWVCPLFDSGETIFVGTLLPLVSHKSAVRAWLFSQDTLPKSSLIVGQLSTVFGSRCSPSLWSCLLGVCYRKGHACLNQKIWIYLTIFVSNTGLGLCRVKVLLWGNSMWGKAKDMSLPSRGEGAIKIPQGDNQTERWTRRLAFIWTSCVYEASWASPGSQILYSTTVDSWFAPFN